MKRLLPVLFLVACNSHDPSRLVGRDGTELNLGKSINVASQSYLNVGFDKNGHPRMTVRDNSEAVPNHALDAATTLGGGWMLASVQKAGQAADAAVAVSAHKADTAVKLGAQSVQKAGIAAETTKAITIPK